MLFGPSIMILPTYMLLSLMIVSILMIMACGKINFFRRFKEIGKILGRDSIVAIDAQ
jgi:hypothetical protein